MHICRGVWPTRLDSRLIRYSREISSTSSLALLRSHHYPTDPVPLYSAPTTTPQLKPSQIPQIGILIPVSWERTKGRGRRGQGRKKKPSPSKPGLKSANAPSIFNTSCKSERGDLQRHFWRVARLTIFSAGCGGGSPIFRS